jgi:hypothetical protein
MKTETDEHRRQREAIFALAERHGLGARRDDLADLLRPAVGLRTREITDADWAVGATRVGGEPDLPLDLPWPVGAEGPLLFVLQVDLALVAPLDLEERLPSDGLLSVFADPFAEDVRVLHHEPGVALARRATPADSQRPPFRACGVEVQAELHLPPPDSAFMDGADGSALFDDDEHDAYWDEVWLAWRERLRPGPAGSCGIHQILGYAMAERLEAQALHEEVLIGFDSDDRANMQWGDVHCVWVFMDRDRLAARAFSELRVEM